MTALAPDPWRSRRRRSSSSSGIAPIGVLIESLSSWPEKKFMAGEPMKPATNRLRGFS